MGRQEESGLHNKETTALCRKSISGKSGISVYLLALTQVRRVSAQRLIKMIAWRAKNKGRQISGTPLF